MAESNSGYGSILSLFSYLSFSATMLDTKPETRGGVGPGETDVQGCSGLGCGEEEEKEILGSLAW